MEVEKRDVYGCTKINVLSAGRAVSPCVTSLLSEMGKIQLGGSFRCLYLDNNYP